MFKTLFDATGKILIYIMLLLLLASFMVWGVGDVVRGTYSDSVASVEGKSISGRHLDELVQQRRNQILSATGQSELPEDYTKILKASILRQLINQELMYSEVDKLGIAVDGRAVLKTEIAKDKSITREKFRDFLRAQGKTESQYVAEIGGTQAVTYVEQAITANPPVSDFVVEKADALENEKRVYEYIEIPENFHEKAEEPKVGELEEYYATNKQRYTLPEHRDATILVIDKSALESSTKTQSNIEKVDSHENEPGDLETSKKSDSEEIYAISNAALDKIAEGKSLEEIASEMKLKVLTFKALDASGKEAEKLPKIRNILKSVFAAEKGAPSELLEDDKGEVFVVFRVDSIEPSRDRSFDEAKADAIKEWRIENRFVKLEKEASEIATQARKEGFDKTASSLGLKIKKSGAIGHAAKDQPSGLLNEIFAAQDSTHISKAYPTDSGGFVIARLSSVIPSTSDALEKFTVKSSVQEQVKQDLLQQYLVYLTGKHKVKIKD